MRGAFRGCGSSCWAHCHRRRLASSPPLNCQFASLKRKKHPFIDLRAYPDHDYLLDHRLAATMSRARPYLSGRERVNVRFRVSVQVGVSGIIRVSVTFTLLLRLILPLIVDVPYP